MFVSEGFWEQTNVRRIKSIKQQLNSSDWKFNLLEAGFVVTSLFFIYLLLLLPAESNTTVSVKIIINYCDYQLIC